MSRLLRIILLTIVLLFFAVEVSAQVMQSATYRIQSDSINVGGLYSSSANYKLEDTTGEIATGYATSTNFGLSAGYQSMQETYLALSVADNVTLSPSLGGISGGESTASTTLTTITDSPAGYQMTITASSSPAMQSGANTIFDFVPSGSNPDYVFSTASTLAHLAFSPEGTDIATRFKDNGVSCNTGSGDTTLACWDGLSTSPTIIALRTSANHPNGIATRIRFKVGIGSSVSQLEGLYTATTTVTVISL